MTTYSVAQLKRDAKEGIINAVMTMRSGESITQESLPERLRGTRRIIDANSNSLTIENPLDPEHPSWLSLPKASLIEYTDHYLRIYAPGYREPTAEEQHVLDEWKAIENSADYQERAKVDALTDGSSTYYQKLAFFRKHAMEYLFGTKQKGLVIDFNKRNAREPAFIQDESIKGAVDLEYRIERVKSLDERLVNATQSCDDLNNHGNELYVRLVSADICDCLEDVLDEYDLTIPSEDREGEEGEARIYGDVYSDLEAGVTDVLATVCRLVKENPDILINTDEIDELRPVSVGSELYVRGFASKICGLFEDLLDENDITIPSDDREGEEGEARIFGDVYYSLEDDIAGILAGLCAEVKATPDIMINVEDYNGFVGSEIQKPSNVDAILANAVDRSSVTNSIEPSVPDRVKE